MSHHRSWKASYNQDAEVLLTEAGSETFKIHKKDAVASGSSAAAQVQSEKVVLTTEGTPANGLGTYRSYYIEDSAGNEQEMARVACVATTLTDGSESAELQFWTRRSGILTKILTVDGAATTATDGNMSFTVARSVTIIDNTDNAWSVVDSGGTPLTYLEFDSRDAAPLILVSQNVHLANNMDILPVTAGGNDLGSTAKEWGDIFIADGKSVKFGDGQDMVLSWDATNLVLTSVAADTGKLVLGVSGEGIDLQLFGATAGYDVLWDQSADTLIFNDSAKLQFGTTAGCATISASTTTLSILAVTDNNTIVIGNATNSFDLKIFGADASHYITLDTSANAVKFEDSTFLDFGTNTAGVGTRGDFQFGFDATQLNLLAAANNAIFKIGNGTESVDFWLYGSSTSHGLTWDASANALKLQDDDILYFGTGAAAGTANAGDISIKWNATKLVVDQLTANSAIDFGVSGAGIDIVLYGDTATRNLTWDQSADSLLFEDNTKLALGTGSDIVFLWNATDLLVSQATVNSAIKWGVSGAGIDMVFYGDTATRDMTWDQSADALLFNDSAKLVLGTGSDLTATHDGTNTLLTSATGNFTIDNTAATGKTIMLLGTDTTATEFDVQNNSAVAILTVKPESASGGTVVAQGLCAKSVTAAAITTTRTLTAADSGGVFSVAKTTAYAVTIPTPAQGLNFTFMVLDTGANAVTISNGSAHLYGQVSVANVATAMTGTTLSLASAGSVGDWVKFEGIDATHYLVTGSCIAAADITIA